MADGRQEPYDPYLPAGGAAGGPGAAPQQGNQRTAALQAVSSLCFLSSVISYRLGLCRLDLESMTIRSRWVYVRSWNLHRHITPADGIDFESNRIWKHGRQLEDWCNVENTLASDGGEVVFAAPVQSLQLVSSSDTSSKHLQVPSW